MIKPRQIAVRIPGLVYFRASLFAEHFPTKSREVGFVFAWNSDRNHRPYESEYREHEERMLRIPCEQIRLFGAWRSFCRAIRWEMEDSFA